MIFIKQDSSSYALRFVSNRLPNLGKCPENIETNMDLDLYPNEDEIVTDAVQTEYRDREPLNRNSTLRRNSTMRQSKRHSDCNVSAVTETYFSIFFIVNDRFGLLRYR